MEISANFSGLWMRLLRVISGIAPCGLPGRLWDNDSFWGVDTGSNTIVIKVVILHLQRRLLDVDDGWIQGSHLVCIEFCHEMLTGLKI